MTYFWILSSNLQLALVSLHANLLYASLYLESLSLAYNEAHLYMTSILKLEGRKLILVGFVDDTKVAKAAKIKPRSAKIFDQKLLWNVNWH